MEKETRPVKYRQVVILPKTKLFNRVNWLLREKYPHYQFRSRNGVGASNGKPNKKFEADVKRLKMGEPVDYVIGFTQFLGCKIDLSKKPLIPRQETEFWVDKAIKEISPKIDGRPFLGIRVLDIFSGSGCVGLAILKNIKNSKVVFAEKDKNLVGQIKKNIIINKIDKKRCQIIQSDVFENVKGKLNYIFANPPYIPTTKKPKIQKSVLQYEPHAALFGGQDGLFFIEKFLKKAQDFLKPDGKIYLEFDSMQKNKIEKLLEKYGYKKWEFKKDQYKKWRWVMIKN